jgi:CBS domain-containing protein
VDRVADADADADADAGTWRDPRSPHGGPMGTFHRCVGAACRASVLPMSGHSTDDGSYILPRLEHARVADAMRQEILSCPADASLRDAARLMCTEHVHMILATSPADGSPLGTLSDGELLEALLDRGAENPPLEEVVARRLDTISSEEPLIVAAELMRRRGTAHLIVRDAHSGAPAGVLSTLDVAGILAWGEA